VLGALEAAHEKARDYQEHQRAGYLRYQQDTADAKASQARGFAPPAFVQYRIHVYPAGA
jgi:hypothetical protein